MCIVSKLMCQSGQLVSKGWNQEEIPCRGEGQAFTVDWAKLQIPSLCTSAGHLRQVPQPLGTSAFSFTKLGKCIPPSGGNWKLELGCAYKMTVILGTMVYNY